jgi:hypothetical protein
MFYLDVFKIDDKSYPNVRVTKLTRKFSVADGPLAGRNMVGEMIRDVIGTYYNYTLELWCTEMSRTEYDEFYEILSSPEDSHTIQVPYAQTTKTFKAYITSGDDELDHMSSSGNFWHGISCNFVAMEPSRKKGGT